MRKLVSGVALILLLAPPVAAGAQQDSVARSKARQDSIAKAVKDSIALMKELGGALAAPSDTTRGAAGAAGGTQTGPTNPRLLPDISAVGDFVADFSPKGTTQEDRARFSVRETELAFQAAVDPYFRGDIFLGISDLEGISIEQAYLTTTSLPHQLQVRLGRWLMPFGKENTIHRHDLHTIEYPYVIQSFLSPDGLKGTGAELSRVFSPFGFYQELIVFARLVLYLAVMVAAAPRLGERPEDLLTAEEVNKSLAGLGYSARLRNYIDINEASNFELSFSAMTGRRERAFDTLFAGQFIDGVNAALARQTLFGTDLTYRWRPLQQGLYKSFMLQGEFMWQLNERNPEIECPQCLIVAPTGPGWPGRDYNGAYLLARYQVTQRGFVDARYDYLQDPLNDGRTLNAGSVYLEWFPSEFSKLVAGYEVTSPSGGTVVNRLLLQATFALGPHKPHPF
jgi:hypothetical protein